MYYVRPDVLIAVDDLSALKNDGRTDFDNIFNTLVLKPRIEDLIEESPYLHEIVKMADGTYFAYSNVNEDINLIKDTGRLDPFIRARGDTIWHALAELFIAVHTKNPVRSLPLEELDGSENRKDTIIRRTSTDQVPLAVVPGLPEQPKSENVHLLEDRTNNL